MFKACLTVVRRVVESIKAWKIWGLWIPTFALVTMGWIFCCVQCKDWSAVEFKIEEIMDICRCWSSDNKGEALVWE